MLISALALAVMLGIHVRAAEFMIYSYMMFPMGEFPAAMGLSDWGVHRISRAFSLGFSLAAPFLIGALIYNLTLGVINRAMPQLMVAFVGAPAITWGGMVLLLVAAPVLLGVWIREMHAFFGSGGGLLP